MADEAGEDDHGNHVWNDLNVFDPDIRDHALHLNRRSLGKAKQQACEHGLNRPPLSEDECRQSDEAAACRHVSREERRLADRQIGAADCCESSR